MTERPIVIYKESGYLFRASDLSEELTEWAIKKFSHRFYDDSACRKCDNRPERHNETCDNCAAYKGQRQLAKFVEHPRADELLFSLPFGAKDRVRQFARSIGRPYVVRDALPKDNPLSRRIRFREGNSLRPWQQEAIPIAKKETRGVIQAPPRAGKTVFAAGFIMDVGEKTIILAAQRDWLVQFRETFIGSDTVDAMTTAKPSQINFCKTVEDFERTDICLCTFAQFMSPRGKALLDRIYDMFTVLVVDEIHLSPALQSSRVLAKFSARYRIGLTGTPARKTEGLYEIVNQLVGPVIYEAKVETVRPTVELLHTGLKLDIGTSDYSRFVNKVEYHKARQQTIVDYVVEAVKKGHLVLIPMQRTKAVDRLVSLINGEFQGKVAAPFYGGLRKHTRDLTIQRARQYQIKVLVGNTRLLSTGLNIPRASMLIEGTLSSNLPNCQQRTARILTPYADKPTPVIVYVLDDSKIMRSMRKNEWWHCVFPKFNPYIAPTVRAQFMTWLAGNSSGSTYGPIDL